jgi:hypothetical protein
MADYPISPITISSTFEQIDFSPEEWKTELVAIAAILVYLIFYTYGRQKNKFVATSWFTATQEFWSSQFSHTSPSLMHDSPAHFLLYASGRDKNIEKMIVTVECAPRHDLISTLYDLGTMAKKTEDSVSIEIHFSEPNDGEKGEVDEFCLALLNANSGASLFKSRCECSLV